MQTKLDDYVLTGASARYAELLTIAVMAVVVGLVDHYAGTSSDPWLSFRVPMIALALGALGAVFAGRGAMGMVRRPGYVPLYYVSIFVMIAVDLGVRHLLGGDMAMVFANWAVLIGSASSINLLLTRVPLLSARGLIDEGNIAGFHPVGMFIAVVFQVLQAWVSVLGAPLVVVVVQLLARRLAVLPLTHLIARYSYGPDCAERLRACETLEYVATRSVADAEGRLFEPDSEDPAVVGTMLLKLPMFAGEAMSAGDKSRVRLGDKLVFLEQMLAFSSPTMVVARTCALAHLAFLQTILGFEKAPESPNPMLEDPASCKAKVADALRGRWASFRALE